MTKGSSTVTRGAAPSSPTRSGTNTGCGSRPRGNPSPHRSRTTYPASSLATLEGVDIDHAHQTLVIGAADPGTAALLKVPLGTPTAECHCVVTNSKGVAIYVAEIIYRNDCVKLHIDLLSKSSARRRRGNGSIAGARIEP